MLGIVRTLQQRVRIALIREVTALMMRMAADMVTSTSMMCVRHTLLNDQSMEMIMCCKLKVH